MTISQIPGAVRLRENQFGVQTLLNTAVVATRRVGWRGGVVVNQNWTDPDTDVGSIDPVALPYPGPLDVTSTKTGIVYYNDLPLRLNAGLLGGISPTTVAVTGRQWDYQVASLTSDVFDVFTNETADDTEATDTTVGIGGLVDSLEDVYPQDVSAVTLNDNWIYSTATIGSNGTNGLSVDSAAIPELGVNTLVRMDTVAGSIGSTELTDTVHDATVRVQNNLDKKRFLNGSNGANKLGGYGRGARVIELVLTVAKTAAMITEANTILTSPKPARFFDIINTSTSLVGTSVPYSDRHRGAFRLFDKAESEIGGNVVLVLTYHGFYSSTLGYAYRRTVVNTQATVAAP
jgi:hypothetical protein